MATQRSRRVTLPGADELFFRSSDPEQLPEPAPPPAAPPPGHSSERQERAEPADRSAAGRTAKGPSEGVRLSRPPRPSGRERHDEKITVYISGPELLALEQTRLALRAEHGLTADRGRLVREAVAVLLADFDEHGEASMIVRRLSED